MFIFSEWSEQDPYAWDVVEPILRENRGFAIFNFTPKGDNHARSLIKFAQGNPEWYVQILTAEDTGIFSPSDLEKIKRDITSRFVAQGRSEDEAIAYFQQEYMCSFDSPVIGSYYGAGMRLAEAQGRITNVPYNTGCLVDTYWDLGIDDSTTIWFVQNVGREIHLIDYYENSGEGLDHYAKILQDKGYVYGRQNGPHDIMVRELGTGKSRWEVAKRLGINFQVAPNLGIDEGINAARMLLNQCWFDKVKCARGVNSLKNYHKEWDERNKVFRLSAKHDWSSHGADAFRMLAVSHKQFMVARPQNNDPGGVGWLIPGVG
jgi:hypothetical protein